MRVTQAGASEEEWAAYHRQTRRNKVTPSVPAQPRGKFFVQGNKLLRFASNEASYMEKRQPLGTSSTSTKSAVLSDVGRDAGNYDRHDSSEHNPDI